jgi:hypothetical protein
MPPEYNPGERPATTIPAKHVTFTSRSPRLSVRCYPGEGPPEVTGGYGSIASVTRSQRRSLTRWSGSDPISLSIPILLEGFRRGRSVEQERAILERMAGIDGAPNLRVKITGTGKLVPHAEDREWYVTDIEWSDAILNSDGRRVRQFATVNVTQIVEAATEKSLAKRAAGKGTHARSYRVRAGDTLRSISRKVLGTPDRWAEIRRLNNISDPRIVGKPGNKRGNVGSVLKMPR